MMLMITVITRVPKIAGKMPPSVLASRGSWLTKLQNLCAISPSRSQAVIWLGYQKVTICPTGSACSVSSESRR